MKLPKRKLIVRAKSVEIVKVMFHYSSIAIYYYQHKSQYLNSVW